MTIFYNLGRDEKIFCCLVAEVYVPSDVFSLCSKQLAQGKSSSASYLHSISCKKIKKTKQKQKIVKRTHFGSFGGHFGTEGLKSLEQDIFSEKSLDKILALHAKKLRKSLKAFSRTCALVIYPISTRRGDFGEGLTLSNS